MTMNSPQEHLGTAKMLYLYAVEQLVDVRPTPMASTATLLPLRDRRQFSRRAPWRRGGRRATDWRR